MDSPVDFLGTCCVWERKKFTVCFLMIVWCNLNVSHCKDDLASTVTRMKAKIEKESQAQADLKQTIAECSAQIESLKSQVSCNIIKVCLIDGIIIGFAILTWLCSVI